jgi:pimeloyl-ACP methyl ester carboxylesterase
MCRQFSLSLLASLLFTGQYLHAQTPIVNDTTTRYSIPVQVGSYPCWGTCDLSPSYNNYVVPSAFSITKITFNWWEPGNNCSYYGQYGATISSADNASTLLASSTNTVCGGTGGTSELDFAGQTIPTSFYLDFHSFDGGLQGGAWAAATNVTIWGIPLSTTSESQIGLPVIFVHGICDKADSWLPAETAVKTYLQQNAPIAYPSINSQEYVVYYDEISRLVMFQRPQSQLAAGAANTPMDEPEFLQVAAGSSPQFFLMALDDLTVPGYETFDATNVANVPIYQKGDELAHVIWTIKKITGAPRVIVVGHSMGGLDARSYIEGLASPTASSSDTDIYLDDIAALITLDTPHGGASIVSILENSLFPSIPFIFSKMGPYMDLKCASSNTIDRSEMIPNGVDTS